MSHDETEMIRRDPKSRCICVEILACAEQDFLFTFVNRSKSGNPIVLNCKLLFEMPSEFQKWLCGVEW